jgi:hypothetical protein
MTKHVFIGQEYHIFEDLIECIVFNTTKQYLIFDDSNKLVMIKTLHAHDVETSSLTIGKLYEFINGVPEPFYNYFQKYYPELNIKNFSLQLNDDELKEFINTYILIINIDEFSSLCNNMFTEKIENIKQKCLNDIGITEEDKLNNIKNFEKYANAYNDTIIQEVVHEFNNKYDEECYEYDILKKIQIFKKEYISKTLKELTQKYLNKSYYNSN